MTDIHPSCTMCDESCKFIVEDLPTGTRVFCSEKCWAEYTGMPVQPEGYYGLVNDIQRSWGTHLERLRDDQAEGHIFSEDDEI